ncbi:MliC family protein [Sphingomonas lenta]|uniref:C-type lysozyme inhibitor domain-containing protein n=1 Tax=Sphingomonas lenta TaxID=1141887 RepID=A0A2A2SF40_9SPHN|nr:MliC family protein [Sphingomonas lenta]PAX07812.1 hypothetical protein CKY28_09290 [Sphingomonas lenta]
MPSHARLILVILPLAGCMPLRPVNLPDPRTVMFRCQTGASVTATFLDRRARLVEPNGRVVELPQRRAETGFLYAGEAGTLSGEPTRISWTPANGAPLDCVAPAA